MEGVRCETRPFLNKGMENQKKIEFYKYLKELFPNLKDTTIMLILEDSLKLISMENGEINFPLEFLELPVEYANDKKYNWNIDIIDHGRLQ
jgi:hypothetical protein